VLFSFGMRRALTDIILPMLTCGRVAFVLAPAFDRLFFSAALALSVAEIPEHHR